MSKLDYSEMTFPRLAGISLVVFALVSPMAYCTMPKAQAQ